MKTINNNNSILEAYLKLQKKLSSLQDLDNFLERVRIKTSVQDIVTNKSSAHHYIPKFFIDGFLDDDGLLFVYNKTNDRIKKNKQGSKGVFFEIDRNSTSIGSNISVSWFEDAYSIFDNIIPPAIKLLRSDIDLPESIRIDLHAHLNTFLIDLYWRNVNNDLLFDTIYNNASVTLTDSNGTRLLSNIDANEYKNDPFFKQLMRFKMTISTLNNISTPKSDNDIFTTSTITFPQKQLCIGDSPFLMKELPKKHTDLLNIPAFIPISNTKLYLRNITLKGQLRFHETSMFNALIINQSSNLICCANKMILEAAIAYYKFAKKENLFDYFKQLLFQF